MQVQSTQRNIAANAQRKILSTFSLPDSFSAADTVQPSFPVELKDVLLLSVSPSGSQQPFICTLSVRAAVAVGG